MNEKKMAVTWVDKNESFFKRTHNTGYYRLRYSQTRKNLVGLTCNKDLLYQSVHLVYVIVT